MPRANACWLIAVPALLAGLLCLPAAAAQSPAEEVDIFVAADIRDFSYREFDPSGRELNREDGFLPGLRLAARATRDRLFARLEAALHEGNVTYDGETQGGTPVRSTTDTRLVSTSAEVGRWFSAGLRGRFGAFLRFASRQWDRDIRSTNNAQGLFEEYRWREVGIGARYVFPGPGAGGWQHELAGVAFAVDDGDLFVELSEIERQGNQPRYDDTSLELGDAAGFRLRYTATRPLVNGRRFRIEPYLAYWEFGRSDTRTVTADGMPTNLRVTEPESESLRVGFAIGVVF